MTWDKQEANGLSQKQAWALINLSWHDIRFYAFSPFCVIPKVLQKLCRDRAKGVMVVPDWPNQPWFPLIAKMLINYPVLVSVRKNLLSLPQNPAEEHRLQKLRLIICELSGVASDAQGFWNKLQTLCVQLENRNPKEICLLCGKVVQVCAQQTHWSHIAVYKWSCELFSSPV